MSSKKRREKEAEEEKNIRVNRRTLGSLRGIGTEDSYGHWISVPSKLRPLKERRDRWLTRALLEREALTTLSWRENNQAARAGPKLGYNTPVGTHGQAPRHG